MTSVAGPKAISLFSGAGGLDIGLERAGWDVVIATDLAPDSMETLRESRAREIPVLGRTANHLQNTHLINADVSTLSASDLRPARSGGKWRPDLLAGGPPCQPWSSAGHQKGLNDPRGQLIAHMLRLVDEVRPRFVLLENVRGLVTAVGPSGAPGEVLRSIQQDLADIGYASRVATLNAADYGAAQRRVRLFIVATSDYELPLFPQPTHDKAARDGRKPWVTLGEALSSLPPADPSEVVYPSGARADQLRALTPGTGIKTAGKVMNNRPSGHWGYRQDSFLADLSLPARTIRAASTPDWVRLPGEEMRRLGWRECAAIQGFPSEWSFQGTAASLFKQIGNAVQVDVAEVVGGMVLSALRRGPALERPTTPPWPPELLKRVRYTEAEHRVNGSLRVRLIPKTTDTRGSATA
ncbi:MAG TPA: DNA cytosine methyltransferase [Jatrophihabitans sp.]|uniref:DNA cytosine methyltransferase n=1 Tax=Jatrophihabitans sp. TaxID=1932789 RepID=UPI002F257751